MDGYGQYCPVALGAEVFAERWTPIILRNLMIGCRGFNSILDGAPGLPRSVLAQRLRRLERDGVVARRQDGYHLTASGEELTKVCLALGIWAARWREVLPEHHDPFFVLWMLSRLIDPATLPRPRIVVRFDVLPERYWLVASHTGNEVCVRNPGFDEDGVVTMDSATLLHWHRGALPLPERTAYAPPWLLRELGRWGRLSPFAGIEPAVGGPPPG